MKINNVAAKMLYDNNININAAWAWANCLQDIQPSEEDDYYPSYKKGDAYLFKEYGGNTYWKQCNVNNEYYHYYAAPEMMDMILFLILNDINLCVIHVNGKLTWQVTDIVNNQTYQNTDTTYSMKYLTGQLPDSLNDYESELQNGLIKAIEVFLKNLDKK